MTLQLVEKPRRSALPRAGVVVAVEERPLLANLELRPSRACGFDLERREGNGNLPLVEMHLVGVDDPLARNDVVIDRVERRRHAAFELPLGALAATDPKIHEALDRAPPLRSVEPAALGRLVRERFVNLLRRRVVNALQMEGAMHNRAGAAVRLNTRDFRLELVERLAPAFRRALEHRLDLGRVGDRIGLHHIHPRTAGGGTEFDLRDGAEQRAAAARVNHMMVDRQALRSHDLGERSPGPMLHALGRAHADLEPPADVHLDRRFGNRIAARAEPSFDMVSRAPGFEHCFARRREDSRNAQRRRLNLAARIIDRVHRSFLRFPEF